MTRVPATAVPIRWRTEMDPRPAGKVIIVTGADWVIDGRALRQI